MTRRSGLQQSVINLYRDCCRTVRKKPPETRTRFQAFVRAQFRQPDITSKDHTAIEYLLRRGKKQLEAYSGENARNILFERLMEGVTDPNGREQALRDYIRSVIENAEISTQGAPPASYSFMRNLPVVSESEIRTDDECIICSDKFSAPKSKTASVTRLPCKHMFDRDCILSWLKLHNTCPNCRHEVESDDPEWINKKKRETRLAAAAVQEEEEANWMYI
ncbi:9557_t:CDS:2 [Ambispora gerdemannii]|uniref:9557_t:CDS:1 n=1 Tax=Ambispora gerdemannii TaxID=144530 RepID=A0A9N8W5B7_9GLOM|nr:9557_t:CDS:2 [Ambispora gerdemannii]